MLRRRQPPPDPETPLPEWQRRFDDASALLAAGPQPAWVSERLHDLRRALIEAAEAATLLSRTADQLGPQQIADDLKLALRERGRASTGVGADDLDHRIRSLRERYEAVNDIINRRELLERQMLNTAADVELLAAQALRQRALGSDPSNRLDDHLQRLDDDLHALALARREVDDL